MSEYVLIFRTGTRTLSADEQARRATAARAWALPLRDRGTLVQTTLMAEDGVTIGTDRSTAPLVAAGSVAAISLVQASDLASAVELARSHPGLEYGSTVEVRPTKPLPGPPPGQPPR
jgi:hypothetical protein